MNVLYIHTHDMGRYNSLYGYQIPTPNMKRAGEDGVVFRHAYAAAPTCSPSRAAMLTGMCAHSCGLLGLVHRGFAITDYHWHLASYLRENGFETALFGAQHETTNPDDLAYNTFVKHGGHGYEQDIKAADAAAEYIHNYKSDKPFFMAAGFVTTHRIYEDSTGKIDPSYVRVPETMPDNAVMRKDYADYMLSAGYVDKAMGIVLDALREKGLYEDTLILLTTDHGIAWPGMKCSLYDGGIGITLALKVPGIQGGRVSDSLVSHLDVFPTICDALGLPAPDRLEGKSLMPILRDENAEINDCIFAEVNYHAAYEPQRCVRTKRYKYIRRYDDYPTYVLPNADEGSAKSFLLENGLAQRKLVSEELYDTYYDTCERNNVAGDPAYEKIKAELADKLHKWMENTGDVLLQKGFVPKPEGARITARYAQSPKDPVYE